MYQNTQLTQEEQNLISMYYSATSGLDPFPDNFDFMDLCMGLGHLPEMDPDTLRGALIDVRRILKYEPGLYNVYFEDNFDDILQMLKSENGINYSDFFILFYEMYSVVPIPTVYQRFTKKLFTTLIDIGSKRNFQMEELQLLNILFKIIPQKIDADGRLLIYELLGLIKEKDLTVANKAAEIISEFIKTNIFFTGNAASLATFDWDELFDLICSVPAERPISQIGDSVEAKLYFYLKEVALTNNINFSIVLCNVSNANLDELYKIDPSFNQAEILQMKEENPFQ
ncbi:MAG: hypothetical protein MJ252_22910 [archaeon]|nr:hypothetical protein [archaeon]